MDFKTLYNHFSKLSGKSRTEEWNKFAKESPKYLREFSDYLKNYKIEHITKKGKKVRKSAFSILTNSIRQNAVIDAWDRERELIMKGQGTYNWTIDEQKCILNSNGIPPLKEKLNIKYEGQHMYSVEVYPEFAGDWHNIQALTFCDHSKEAHNGNTRLNQTHGYYD